MKTKKELEEAFERVYQIQKKQLEEFINQEPNEDTNLNKELQAKFGIFIAQELRLPQELKTKVSKRKDLFDIANKQAIEKYGIDKRMIDTQTLKIYGTLIYKEYLKNI